MTGTVSTNSLSDFDLHLLWEGTHFHSYDKLGARVLVLESGPGTSFALWAPGARSVSVVGDFNGWNPAADPMAQRGDSGVWERFVPGVGPGARYKYAVDSATDGERTFRPDPYANAAEAHPNGVSVVADLSNYAWGDGDWVESRRGRQSLEAPIAIYELHLGSWRRVPEEWNRWLYYSELADRLGSYVAEMGFTHVQILGVAEQAFGSSWDDPPLAPFAPTGRFGGARELMALVDKLHQRGIGVILEWQPARLLASAPGADRDDPDDPLKDPRVRTYLAGNALFWLDRFHVDGLHVNLGPAKTRSVTPPEFDREQDAPEDNHQAAAVPAVPSIETPEGFAFFRRLNDRIHAEFPGVLTIAEGRVGWPNLTRPTEVGGLGFNLTWDLNWVRDTLDGYLRLDPVHRKFVHEKVTARSVYAFSENFVLPLSHEEVVGGKGSLLMQMPEDDWRKFATARLLFGYQYTLPGKKLLFMGDEIGQWEEWDDDSSLEWHLLDRPFHRGLQRWVRDLNTMYRGEPAFHEQDCYPSGFGWIHHDDFQQSVISFVRRAKSGDGLLLAVCNFTPLPRQNYRIGIPRKGHWEEILNSDAQMYGGSGHGNMGGRDSTPIPAHGQSQSINLVLPPLGITVLKAPTPR